MQLQEVFDQLSSGEFSQLCIGGNQPGVIDENNYARVVGHINLGLTAIYSRFSLKKGELILRLQPDQTKYQLYSKFAVTGSSDEAVRYLIDDASAPFLDDIIKVEEVLAADGTGLPLNDPSNPLSLTTPSSLTLYVPESVSLQDLTIKYRGNHNKLIVEDGYIDPEDTLLDLPESHLSALLYYVGSRVNNPVGMTNEFHAGNSYFAKYEEACQALEGQGVQIQQERTNTRLRSGGWV